MASEEANANEAIAKAVAVATRVEIEAVTAATTERPQNADDKYYKLKNFRLEVNNIFRSYNTPHTEQLAIVKKWLGRKGLQFIESLTHTEKAKCNIIEGLFAMLNNKFKPQFNETIKSLQLHKLSRQCGKCRRMDG